MNTEIITLQYNEFPVLFQSSGAWLNATAIAKHFLKKPETYLKTLDTQEYISALQDVLFPIDNSDALKSATEQNQLVKVKKGGLPENQGTWLHPKLSIHFARWLNAKFAVWCDMQIEKLLYPQYGLKELPPSPYISESQAQQFKKSMEAHCKSNGAKYPILYRKVYEYFGITTYTHIPDGKLEEAAQLCGIKLLPLAKPRLPKEQQVFTFTQAELDALIAEKLMALPKPEPLEGEVLPETDDDDVLTFTKAEFVKIVDDFFNKKPPNFFVRPENTFHISFEESSGLKTIALKFDTSDNGFNRWFISKSDGVILVKPVSDDEFLVSNKELPKRIAELDGMIGSHMLPEIIKAAASRL
jgi:hypothetical protein